MPTVTAEVIGRSDSYSGQARITTVGNELHGRVLVFDNHHHGPARPVFFEGYVEHKNKITGHKKVRMPEVGESIVARIDRPGGQLALFAARWTHESDWNAARAALDPCTGLRVVEFHGGQVVWQGEGPLVSQARELGVRFGYAVAAGRPICAWEEKKGVPDHRPMRKVEGFYPAINEWRPLFGIRPDPSKIPPDKWGIVL